MIYFMLIFFNVVLDTNLFFLFVCFYFTYGYPLVAQTVKNLPAVQETQVQSLCWDDPLEKGMAIHSSILAWRIPWTEEPSGLQSMGSQRVGYNWGTTTTDGYLIFSASFVEMIILSSTELTWYLCKKLFDHKCKSPFLDFSSIQYICMFFP